MPSDYGHAMKKRSKAGGEPIKGRRRKTQEPKRLNAPEPKQRRNLPKAAMRSNSSIGNETEVAQLTRDRDEALEQQTATSEVLRIISSARGDLQSVFTAMLEKAVRMCDATFGNIYRWQGGALHLVASYNTPPALAEARRRLPLVPYQLPNHVIDAATTKEYIERSDPGVIAAVELGGVRTFLALPILRDNELIGSFSVYRQKVRPFTDKQIELVQNFAAQAVIAIENARLLNELKQSLEQQTATADVLKVISTSSGDLQPVFEIMLGNAVRICQASLGNMTLYENGHFRHVAIHGAPAAYMERRAREPVVMPNPAQSLGRLASTKQLVHIPDIMSEPSHARGDLALLAGARTLLIVPMLKEQELVGAIGIYRQEVKPFADKQIELLQNFAAQAVIAIENARLLNQLRQRTDDLSEALEQQTATSEVLQVISASPGDLQPVFAAMLDKAARICDANFGNIMSWDGDALRLVATHNTPPAFAEHRGRMPFRPNQGNPISGMLATKAVVHVADLAQDERYTERRDPEIIAAVELGGIRTFVAVPMLKEDKLIGALIVYRKEVRPFTNKQIELVKNFAAQAVIAIENARLLSELRQSLDQQTAMSNVLQVISSSPGDLEPVFTTMLEKAVRLCEAKYGTLYLPDDGRLRLVAAYDVPEFFAARRGVAFDPAPGGGLDEALKTKRAVQITDLAATKSYFDRHPSMVEAVELAGIRTGIAVPMLKDDNLIGIIGIHRREVLPFTDKQIELVKNFAAQAVIAIENARLLNELRQRTTDLTEALEQQTATSEVLEVISSSPGDLEPVFATLLGNAVHVCEANFGVLTLYEGEDRFRVVAMHHAPPAYVELRRREPVISPGPFLRMVTTKQAFQIADMADELAYKDKSDPNLVSFIELTGVRTNLSVPMLKDSAVIGIITVYRTEVRPFADKQTELLKNFAAQAVIAIENTRLLNELRERTDQLQAQSKELADLNQQLEQRVSDQVGEIERMGRLRRFLPPQVADLIVASGSEKQLESHRREITALFCDLRGFTGFTESADAEDVIALLREYHAAVGDKIIKYSGTLERYAGDGVMVVFNDPVPVENPALQAVLMALEMRDAIGALTETWHRWGHEIGFGIGIAHGFATLGTIGFEGRFDYAAIGTVSNVASRLCDEAKPGQILISPRVLTKVENAVKVEPVGEFELKGIRRPLAAYNVVAAGS